MAMEQLPSDGPQRGPNASWLTGGVRTVPAWRHGDAAMQLDRVVDETPVALVFNGVSHAVMMATPRDLEDFALGFALTEGLLDSVNDLRGIDLVERCEGLEASLEVSAACAWRLKERRRTLAGRTGCGLCGVDSLAQIVRPTRPVRSSCVAPGAISKAHEALRESQEIQRLTGGCHAAAWCDRQGEVVLAREDVGRHNALDKLVGAMVRRQIDATDGFVFITSRASFEMVQKTAAAGIGALVAISAPTSFAIEAARASGVALAGFARGASFVGYALPERFGLTECVVTAPGQV